MAKKGKRRGRQSKATTTTGRAVSGRDIDPRYILEAEHGRVRVGRVAEDEAEEREPTDGGARRRAR
jgi:hypothetical protein